MARRSSRGSGGPRTTKRAAETAREYVQRFAAGAERNVRNRIEQASHPETERYWREVHDELRKLVQSKH